MSSATYTLFRNAILAEQQVTFSYGSRQRELCPRIIGTKHCSPDERSDIRDSFVPASRLAHAPSY